MQWKTALAAMLAGFGTAARLLRLVMRRTAPANVWPAALFGSQSRGIRWGRGRFFAALVEAGDTPFASSLRRRAPTDARNARMAPTRAPPQSKKRELSPISILTESRIRSAYFTFAQSSKFSDNISNHRLG